VNQGQTRRFAVPCIDIDISFRELLGAQGTLSTPSEARALPSGYVPITGNGGAGTTLEAGLLTAETQTLAKPPRVPLPEDDVEDDAPVETGNTIAASTRDKPATKAQRDKLNVLVGTLREANEITTEQLWRKLAKHRNIDVTEMLEHYSEAYTPDGVLHWSPLRESLTRAEAHMLIDALEGLEAKV
jgi:hypothetical protein